MLFKVIAGNHRENGKTYNSGDVVESRLNLDKMFHGAFQRLDDSPMPNIPAPKEAAPEPVAQPEQEVREEVSRGKDVTKDYPEAKEAGLEVFKANGFFFVYESGSNEALNTDGLKANQVAKFIRQY